MLDLSIIIVNFNTSELLSQCIASIHDQKMTCSYEIIVVDNLSTDNSKQIITKNFPSTIWIENKLNEGFGRANNIGIKEAKGRHILLLNSDTIIIRNTIEKALVRLQKEGENVGLVTCQLLNPDCTLQKSVFYYNASFKEVLNNNLLFDFLTRSIPKTQRQIVALHGAFLMFNKKKLEQIGYFDPDFFLYAEEFEWCRRIRKNNLSLMFYNDLSIIHLEEGSSVSKPWNTKQRYLSNSLLFKKEYGSLGLLFYLILNFFNLLTNFILMWRLDHAYRSDFKKMQTYFWSLTPRYIAIFFGVNKVPLRLTRST